MSKVILKIEIEEKDYKALIGEEVFNIWKGNTILSTIFNAIKTATPITESDDCVSRRAVIDILTPYINENKKSNDLYLAGCGDGAYHSLCAIKSLPCVKPKLAFNERITTIPMPFE